MGSGGCGAKNAIVLSLLETGQQLPFQGGPA